MHIYIYNYSCQGQIQRKGTKRRSGSLKQLYGVWGMQSPKSYIGCLTFQGACKMMPNTCKTNLVHVSSIGLYKYRVGGVVGAAHCKIQVVLILRSCKVQKMHLINKGTISQNMKYNAFPEISREGAQEAEPPKSACFALVVLFSVLCKHKILCIQNFFIMLYAQIFKFFGFIAKMKI